MFTIGSIHYLAAAICNQWNMPSQWYSIQALSIQIVLQETHHCRCLTCWTESWCLQFHLCPLHPQCCCSHETWPSPIHLVPLAAERCSQTGPWNPHLCLSTLLWWWGCSVASASPVCTMPFPAGPYSLREAWLPIGARSSCSPLKVLFSLKGKCGEEEQLRCSWGLAIVPWVCLRSWGDTRGLQKSSDVRGASEPGETGRGRGRSPCL